MVAARRIIALSIDPDQRHALVDISRSRTEATGCVERARKIIGYLIPHRLTSLRGRLG